MAYSLDKCTGGTATADNSWDANYVASKAFDNDETTTRWSSTDTAMPHWIKYNFGDGIVWIIRKLRLKPWAGSPAQVKDFTLQGSNNDSNWTTIYTGQAADNGNWQDFIFTNTIAYRYYLVNITTSYYQPTTNAVSITEIEMMVKIPEGGAFLLNFV